MQAQILFNGFTYGFRRSKPIIFPSYPALEISFAKGTEYTRKCLTIHCARRIGSIQVIEQLANAMIDNGIPEYIRSDNGPEFIAKELRSWLSGIGVKTAYITPGSPWENGFCESFNGTFRDNLLDGEIFYNLKEAQIIVGEWVKHYNHVRPHSALGYRPPAPQTQVPKIIQNQPMLLQ